MFCYSFIDILSLCAILALPVSASPLSNAGSEITDANTIDDWIVVHPVVRDAVADKHVRNYWTTERISNVDRDERVEDPPPLTDEDLSTGQEYPYEGAIQTTVGRLMYTSHELDTNNTVDYSCTATLVESRNRATLVTAAHCIHAGISIFFQGYHDNLLWIPGFRDGKAPLGTFTAHSIVFNRVWLEQQSFEDRAFIVLNLDSTGRPAGESLGPGQHLEFNTGLPTLNAQRWHLGYTRYYLGPDDDDDPRQGTPAFTGDRLASCNGSAEAFTFVPELRGVPCLMSGGASGGPNFENLDLDTGYGTVVGINIISDGGFEDDEFHGSMWGANVTDSASQSLWEKAQSIIP